MCWANELCWGRRVFNECDVLEWEWGVHQVIGGTGRAQETGPGSGEISGELENQSLESRSEGWEDHGIGTETKGLPPVPLPKTNPRETLTDQTHHNFHQSR